MASPFTPATIPSASSGSSGAMTQLFDSTASGSVASFDATGLSGVYNHLVVILLLRGTTAATSVIPRMSFNGDTGANYDTERVYAQGATPSGSPSIGQAGIELPDASAASSSTGAATCVQIIIPSYAQTTFHKHAASFGWNPRTYGSGGEYAFEGGGVWMSTAAITQVTVTPSSGSWAAGSRMSVYGLT